MMTALWSTELNRCMTTEEARVALGPTLRLFDGAVYDKKLTGVAVTFCCTKCGQSHDGYRAARECFLGHKEN